MNIHQGAVKMAADTRESSENKSEDDASHWTKIARFWVSSTDTNQISQESLDRLAGEAEHLRGKVPGNDE